LGAIEGKFSLNIWALLELFNYTYFPDLKASLSILLISSLFEIRFFHAALWINKSKLSVNLTEIAKGYIEGLGLRCFMVRLTIRFSPFINLAVSHGGP
jgi:hypothetical protein